MEGGVSKAGAHKTLPSLRFLASKAAGRAWGGERCPCAAATTLVHCDTSPAPLPGLSGWEEQEGGSTSSIPTSLRSDAAAEHFLLRDLLGISFRWEWGACALDRLCSCPTMPLFSVLEHIPAVWPGHWTPVEGLAQLPRRWVCLEPCPVAGGAGALAGSIGAGAASQQEGVQSRRVCSCVQPGPCCSIAVCSRPAG